MFALCTGLEAQSTYSHHYDVRHVGCWVLTALGDSGGIAPPTLALTADSIVIGVPEPVTFRRAYAAVPAAQAPIEDYWRSSGDSVLVALQNKGPVSAYLAGVVSADTLRGELSIYIARPPTEEEQRLLPPALARSRSAIRLTLTGRRASAGSRACVPPN